MPRNKKRANLHLIGEREQHIIKDGKRNYAEHYDQDDPAAALANAPYSGIDDGFDPSDMDPDDAESERSSANGDSQSPVKVVDEAPRFTFDSKGNMLEVEDDDLTESGKPRGSDAQQGAPKMDDEVETAQAFDALHASAAAAESEAQQGVAKRDSRVETPQAVDALHANAAAAGVLLDPMYQAVVDFAIGKQINLREKVIVAGKLRRVRAQSESLRHLSSLDLSGYLLTMSMEALARYQTTRALWYSAIIGTTKSDIILQSESYDETECTKAFAMHLIKIPPKRLTKQQRIMIMKALYFIDFVRDQTIDVSATFKPPSFDVSDSEAVKERLFFSRKLRDLLLEDRTHHHQEGGDKSAYLLAVEKHIRVVESVEGALEVQAATGTSGVRSPHEVVYLESLEGVPIALRKT